MVHVPHIQWKFCLLFRFDKETVLPGSHAFTVYVIGDLYGICLFSLFVVVSIPIAKWSVYFLVSFLCSLSLSLSLSFSLSLSPLSLFCFNSSILAICADGSYHKYYLSDKGECIREKLCKFLQMTDDWCIYEMNLNYDLYTTQALFFSCELFLPSISWWCYLFFVKLYSNCRCPLTILNDWNVNYAEFYNFINSLGAWLLWLKFFSLFIHFSPFVMLYTHRHSS